MRIIGLRPVADRFSILAELVTEHARIGADTRAETILQGLNDFIAENGGVARIRRCLLKAHIVQIDRPSLSGEGYAGFAWRGGSRF